MALKTFLWSPESNKVASYATTKNIIKTYFNKTFIFNSLQQKKFSFYSMHDYVKYKFLLAIKIDNF